jgi:tRNA-specific 2-thiouridylase
MVAMSGGVDSSVAAALLLEQGHEVVGVTLKLWSGDSTCCSVKDVEDARFVAYQLGIKHTVFNLSAEFERAVVEPYVSSHALGNTPNPCIECNRSIKFDLLASRARALGFDFLATGHHARIVTVNGRKAIARGVDGGKDQSYVIAVMDPWVLDYLALPIGDLTKAQVREMASRIGLRTAAKPDSLEVCFIGRDSGREEFLSRFIDTSLGEVVDIETGRVVDEAVFETVTVGQRRRIGSFGDGMRRYVVEKDPESRRIYVGTAGRLLVDQQPVEELIDFFDSVGATGCAGTLQTSAHGRGIRGRLFHDRVVFDSPARRVAPGQTVVLYQDDIVLASAKVSR